MITCFILPFLSWTNYSHALLQLTKGLFFFKINLKGYELMIFPKRPRQMFLRNDGFKLISSKICISWLRYHCILTTSKAPSDILLIRVTCMKQEGNAVWLPLSLQSEKKIKHLESILPVLSGT